MYVIMRSPTGSTSPVMEVEGDTPRNFVVMEFIMRGIDTDTGEPLIRRGKAVFKKTDECLPYENTLAQIYDEVSVDIL